jgi:flagellar biosynthesis chaperone FliJ
MMRKIQYPLAQVLDVKKKRVEDAEKVVQEKRRLLEVEQEKLAQAKRERDKVRDHRDAKLAQLRHAMDTETTSPEVQRMKQYLEVVKERLAGEEKKVDEQNKQVRNAETALEAAQEDLKRRRLELDKIKMHRDEWEREAKRELLIEEQREQDELGSIMHQSKRMRDNQ